MSSGDSGLVARVLSKRSRALHKSDLVGPLRS